MVEVYFLVSSPWLTQSAFLYNLGPPAQGWYNPTVGSALPHQQNAPQTFPQVNLMKATQPMCLLLPKVDRQKHKTKQPAKEQLCIYAK